MSNLLFHEIKYDRNLNWKFIAGVIFSAAMDTAGYDPVSEFLNDMCGAGIMITDFDWCPCLVEDDE